MTDARCLVTGGAGFIGSHLVERLLREGCRVTVLDDLSTGRSENLPAHPALAVHRGSVTDARLVTELVERSSIVFHLAAVVGVELVAARPLRAMHVNVRGTEVVLDAASRATVPVVLASSSEVYGAAAPVPFDEAAPLQLEGTALRTDYARSKAWGERRALERCASDGLRVVIARLFNTCGPRQRARYGMVLPRFVEQALRNAPLRVFGDGLQTRCFTHVDDAVEALLRLSVAPGAFGRVFNVGSDRETTILELAERVRAICGSRSRIVHASGGAARTPDARRRLPRLDRLAAATGFRPALDLDRIVEDVVRALGGVTASAG